MSRKTMQVMKMNVSGRVFTVVKHLDTNMNPYWLYEHFHAYNEYGSWTERKKLIVKYQDFNSILYHLIGNYDFYG